MRWLVPALVGIALAVTMTLLGQGSSRAAGTPLAIHISGNQFVDGAGQTVQLRGVNVSSSEYACEQGYGFADDYYASDSAANATAAAIAAWGANVVRIPLNEDCWLGINPLNNNTQYQGAGYQQVIEHFVSALNAHGIYAILDLHWTAPGTQPALEQQPMPDYDHSPAFWTSVATTFKSNPAVIFDLFNEPYDPTDPRSGDDQTASDAVTWGCWQTGTKPDPVGGGSPPISCNTQAYDDGNPPSPTARYRIAGMQTLLTAVRNTGATQPIMVGGLNYANDLGDTSDANGSGNGWMQHAPDDPLNQEAASFHNYQGTGKCDNQSCWDGTIAAVAAHVPVVTGEFAEDNYLASACTATPGSDTFDNRYMTWADTKNVSYVSWVWLVDDAGSTGCDRHGLISNYNGTPVAPNGTAVHDHLLARAATVSSSSSSSTTSSTTTTATTTTTTTTTSKPSCCSKPRPPVKLSSFHVSLNRPGTVLSFRLRSPQNATGSLTGQTARAYAAAAVARRHVGLGTTRFKLKTNKTRTITLRLSRGARVLLRRHKSLKVSITITLQSSGHRRTVIHRSVTLRRR